MPASVSGSKAVVASSRINRAGSRISARGDGDALSLAAGKPRATLADHRVHALRELGDEAPGFGAAKGALDLRGSDSRVSQRDVRRNRVVEQKGLLRYVSDHSAPCRDIDIAHGHVVDPDIPEFGPKQSDNEVGNGRLSSPRPSDNRDEPSGRQHHRDVLQNAPGAVRKTHVSQYNFPGETGRDTGQVGFWHPAGSRDRGPEKSECWQVKRDNLKAVLEETHFLKRARKQERENEKVLHRLVPYRQEDIQPAGDGQGADDFM